VFVLEKRAKPITVRVCEVRLGDKEIVRIFGTNVVTLRQSILRGEITSGGYVRPSDLKHLIRVNNSIYL
jgi:hypothetical protein